MTQTINRLYASHHSAMAAVADLKKAGFADDDIRVVGPKAGPTGDGEVAGAMRGHVPEAHLASYQDGVRRGETLVSVRANFGFAARATDSLDRHGPTASALPDAGYPPLPKDPNAPLSAYLGWKVLISDPAPLSSWLGWRTVLPEGPSARAAAAARARSNNPAPLSSTVGLKVLTDEPAPLSKRAGWATLSDDPAPLSKRINRPVLSDNPTPLSARVGWRTLSHEPAPLSGMLGWRTLSRDPAPLSRLFGWRVLSD